MSNKSFHVTGAPAVGPNVPSRKEFNDFAKDTDVLNLYLLALDRIQNADQATLTSFFQIGGIHGKPYTPWDNVQGQDNPTFGGYCTHGSVIFPTWHRPYVAIYEQVIWSQASQIANSYGDLALRNKYQDAVKRLRQPYWDWAANTTLHPLFSTAQTVTVVDAPKGDTKDIRNPLISYPFHPLDPSFTGSFAVWRQTVRHPTDNTPDAQSQPDRVQSAMDNSSEQLRDNTFNLLAFNHDWASFSNHTDSDNSLEAIHDQVHVLVGWNGHMGDVPMAAFDPIFFLHHCNVDRLLALWQALNPTLWVVPGPSGEGSLTVPSDKTVDASTDLTPFHVNDSTFWTSTTSRNTTSFGYAYPETNYPQASPEELRAKVAQAVMQLYGPRFDVSQALASAGVTAESVAAKPSITANPSSNPPSAANPHLPGRYQDWYAVVTVSPYHFSSSGYVHIFLCDPNSIPSSGDWVFSPERVGDIGIFRNTSGNCANCNRREEAGELVTGRVPLTHALIKKGWDINNVEEMEEYLKAHMHWRCSLVDGSELPLENAPTLQVRLCSALCEKPEFRGAFGAFPRRHEPQTHHSVTHGKLGGFFTGSV